MTRKLAALYLALLILPLGAVELTRTLNLPADGIELRYPEEWKRAKRNSTVIGYHEGYPVTAGEPASGLLVAPEHDGFTPTLFVQSRTNYGPMNEYLLQNMTTGIRSVGARIPNASFELREGRLISYGDVRAAVFDYSFSTPDGRRLSTRHWVLSTYETVVVTYTDTADRFPAGVPVADAMVESMVFSKPPPAVGYDTIINMWVTIAMLVSATAIGLAWYVHRRRQRVEEYPEDFIPEPGKTPDERT